MYTVLDAPHKTWKVQFDVAIFKQKAIDNTAI